MTTCRPTRSPAWRPLMLQFLALTSQLSVENLVRVQKDGALSARC